MAERALRPEDRDKIRRLLETADPDNVRLAVSLLEETASDEDVEDLFTEELIGALLSTGTREMFTLTTDFLKGREDAWERRLEGMAARAFEEMTFGWPVRFAVPGWSLSALMNLPEELAERLDWSSGRLDTEGLTNLSDTAAESLSKHVDPLHLDLDELPESAAEILRQHPSFQDDDDEDWDEDDE